MAMTAEEGFVYYVIGYVILWIAAYDFYAGKPFPDFSLVALNSRREMRLSDLVKKAGARPLVLNFGSCS